MNVKQALAYVRRQAHARTSYTTSAVWCGESFLLKLVRGMGMCLTDDEIRRAFRDCLQPDGTYWLNKPLENTDGSRPLPAAGVASDGPRRPDAGDPQQ